jgi:hypothetical protein
MVVVVVVANCNVFALWITRALFRCTHVPISSFSLRWDIMRAYLVNGRDVYMRVCVLPGSVGTTTGLVCLRWQVDTPIDDFSSRVVVHIVYVTTRNNHNAASLFRYHDHHSTTT